ncbi:MAG: transglutaminase domain-containing protein [Spirochaetaceae bacterium]|nr:transglutaminase domain-containing protein [Spirochaetaceae bacterium]
MRRTARLCIALVFFALAASALAERAPERAYERIDRAIRSMPPARSIGEVVAFIAGAATSEREKARGAFTWIAENIGYDVEAFFDGTKPAVDPEGVFRSRKSVCAGYSALYASIAQRMGLEATAIGGRAKGYGYRTGERDIPVNHDWNAVRFDGAWHLLDCTWGAGSVDDDSRKFERGYSAFWFDCEPRLFALWHLPQDPSWQLLPDPITYAAYLAESGYEYGDYEELFRAGISSAQILSWHGKGAMPDAYDVGALADCGILPSTLVKWCDSGSLPDYFSVKALQAYGFAGPTIAEWYDAGVLPESFDVEALQSYGVPAQSVAEAVEAGGLVDCFLFEGLDLTIVQAPARRFLEAGKPLVLVLESSTLTEVGLDNNEEWSYMVKRGDSLEATLVPKVGNLSVTIHTVSSGKDGWFVLLDYTIR